MERIRHPEITPLEISELRQDGVSLWEWSQKREFASALRRALDVLRVGSGTTGLSEPVTSIISGFDAIFLTGGGVQEESMRSELSTLGCPVAFGAESVFGGIHGGFELLRLRGQAGWVADLGKSQFKLGAPGRRWRFPRDWTRLRTAGDVSRAEEPAQRRRLREFIALKLQIAMVESGQRPPALVFALPAKLDNDGTPHRSNFAGMEGDRALLPDALRMAGLSGLPLLVINDAELAAFGAITDERLAGFRKILVLTLGSGIGAALIHRRP